MSDYAFPSDLRGNQQTGHWIVLKATPGGVASRAGLGPLSQQTDTFAFYIPGGGQNTLTWQQAHDYTDIKLARLASAAAIGVAGLFGAGEAAQAATSAIGGAATMLGAPINPRVEVLFKNTNLREFQMNFLMAPANDKDASAMKDMIKRIRFHAAPEFVAGKTFFISPSKFNIDFYYVDDIGIPTINDKIPKIETSVIKRVDVDYTPQGEWSTFHDGTPVSAMLTILFQETVIIDKNKVNQGY